MLELADDAASVKSFDTVLPSYSEATLPKYEPPAPASQQSSGSSSRPRTSRPPSVPQTQQILSYSQSNLPLRFNGPAPPSHPWSPKIVYPSATPKRRPGAELNIFFRSNKPATDPLAHGDTSVEAPTARRPSSSSPRTPTVHSFQEEIRVRELDALTRQIARGKQAQAQRRMIPSPPPPLVPQIVGPPRRESRLLGEEWDSLAVEAQREEIVIRISELESQFQGRGMSADARAILREEIASLMAILSTRREDVTGILASNVNRLRELTQTGRRVSHLEKQQIKADMLSMKGEITFLEQRAVDLEKFARTVDDVNGEGSVEEESNNWDHWMENNYGRR
jgi:hypothetical protein